MLGSNYERLQDELIRIELLKKFGGRRFGGLGITNTDNVTTPGSSLASSLAFSTLKRLITSKSQPPLAKPLTTFLPSFLPSLQPRSPPGSDLPFYPPLEVEITEDSGSSLVDLSSSPEQQEADDMSDNSGCLSITVASSVDQIPSTITSLSPR